MSSNRPYKDGIARFLTVPLKPKSGQNCERNRCISDSKKVIFSVNFSITSYQEEV